MKKILKSSLSIGAGITTLAPAITVISCGSETTTGIYGLVTDSGSVTDGGFNEIAHDALNLVAEALNGKGTKAGKSDSFSPAGEEISDLVASYKSAYEAKKEVLFTPGYKHIDSIKYFNKNNEGENLLKFIVADAEIESFDETQNSNIAAIYYKTKESSFLAGYLSCLYLDAIKDEDPIVSLFGGGAGAGVTDFMTGFVYGVKYWNDNNGDKKDVEFATFGNDEDYTNSGFNPGGDGESKAQTLIAKNADIILPVSSPQIPSVIKAIKNKNERKDKTKVIGVDIDVKKKYSESKDIFLTSILKDVTGSYYDFWLKEYGKDHEGVEVPSGLDYIKGYGKTTICGLSTGKTGIETSNTGKISDTDVAWKTIYTKIDKDEASSSSVYDAAANLDNVTWEDALSYIKQNASQ